MKTDRRKYWLFLLLLFMIFSRGMAKKIPDPGGSFKSDSIFLKAGHYILFRDSSFYAKHDTLLILPDTVYYVTETQQLNESVSLYDSISGWAHNKPFVNNLLKLLIVKNANREDKKTLKQDDKLPFQQYKGKTIRNIRLANVDVLGPGINDTIFMAQNGWQKFLNSTHVKTRNKTILNNLLFKKGDVLDPAQIKDNERLLRELPFIRDARLLVIPVANDQVDVLVISQDQYTLGFELNPNGLNMGNSSVFEKNFLGYGHDLELRLLYDFYKKPATGFQSSYNAKNLFGSFVEAGITYTNAFGNRFLKFSGNRNFLTPETKYSFGAENSVVKTTENFDTSLSFYPLRYNYQDYWLGRAVIINAKRDRIILSGRFINNNIYERPVIEETEYHRLQRYRLLLGNIAFAREDFYKANLIYNFGRTEDIPYGMLLGFTGGFEDNEFFQSIYSGLEFSYGNIFKKFGYLYWKTSLGGFFNNHNFNRGMAQIHINYFSRLFSIHRFQFRQFVNIDYTTGIRRFADERLYLNDGTGIRGFNSDSLSGTQRLAFNIETVVFSPFYLYGFRFVFYSFADLGFIGNSDDVLINQELYSGLGFGLRIRNENMSFNTLQIRFGFYPVIPTGFNPEFISVSGEKYYRPGRFNPNRPETFLFR